MSRKIYTADTLNVSGPYSHAVDGGEYVFFSGQTALNAHAIKEKGSIAEQTHATFENLQDVLKEAGLTLEDVVKVNAYLTTMDDFEEMNEVYKTYFTAPYPARTCVAVYQLPLGADLEIEVIAKRPS